MSSQEEPLSWRQQRPVQGFGSFRSTRRGHRTCGACLVSQDQVLLVKQRGTGKWGFPKGSKNDGETNYECMVRELREETGLFLDEHHPAPLHCQRFMACTVYFFTLDVHPSSLPLLPHDTAEIETVAWLPLVCLGQYELNCVTKYVYRTLLSRPLWKEQLVSRQRRTPSLPSTPTPGEEV